MEGQKRAQRAGRGKKCGSVGGREREEGTPARCEWALLGWPNARARQDPPGQMNALATPLQDEWQDSIEKRVQSEGDWPARVELGEKRLGRRTGCCQVILAGVASRSTTQCRKRRGRRCCPLARWSLVARRFVQTMRTRLVPIVTRRGPMMGFRLPPTAQVRNVAPSHTRSSLTPPAQSGPERPGMSNLFIWCGCTLRNAAAGNSKHQDKTLAGTQVSGETQLRSPAAEGRFLGAETGARRRPLALNPRRPVLRCCRQFRCA